MAGGRQQHQGESQEPARLHSGAGSPLNSIYLLFVHLPSRNNVHFEPSGENSNLYVYAVGDKTFSLKRLFPAGIFMSPIQVQASPSTTPLDTTASPWLLNSL